MISRVAVAHGRPFMAVAREPFALTLLCFLQIGEHERIAALAGRFMDVMRAGYQVFAFHKPEKLAEVHRELMGEAGFHMTPEESEASAVAMFAAVAKLDAELAAEKAKQSAAADAVVAMAGTGPEAAS